MQEEYFRQFVKGASGRGQWKGRVRAEVLRRGYWNAKRVRCARDAQTLTACRPGESSEIREGHACQKGLKMKGFKRRRKALEKKGERMWDAKGVRACARDAQILTPRVGGRVRALRARDATQREGARQERETLQKGSRMKGKKK